MVAAFFLPLADTTVISNIWYFLIFLKFEFTFSSLLCSFSAQSSSSSRFPIADSINPGGTFPIPPQPAEPTPAALLPPPIKGSLYEWDMILLMSCYHHLYLLEGGGVTITTLRNNWTALNTSAIKEENHCSRKRRPILAASDFRACWKLSSLLLTRLQGPSPPPLSKRQPHGASLHQPLINGNILESNTLMVILQLVQIWNNTRECNIHGLDCERTWTGMTYQCIRTLYIYKIKFYISVSSLAVSCVFERFPKLAESF